MHLISCTYPRHVQKIEPSAIASFLRFLLRELLFKNKMCVYVRARECTYMYAFISSHSFADDILPIGLGLHRKTLIQRMDILTYLATFHRLLVATKLPVRRHDIQIRHAVVFPADVADLEALSYRHGLQMEAETLLVVLEKDDVHDNYVVLCSEDSE